MGINLGSTAISDLKIGTTQVNKVYLGSTEVWSSAPPVLRALKFSSAATQTLGIDASVLGTITPTFEYSNDGSTWTSWNVSNTLSFGSGTDLYIRGSNTMLASTGSNYVRFVFGTSAPVACTGNIMHLYDYTQDLLAIPNSETSNRGLKSMFKDATVLTSAPELPATTLCTYAYYQMFSGCTSLATAPALPATTLGNNCYQSMFSGCTSIVTPPVLSATSLTNYCYQSMFSGCTSLATAPALPATTLTTSCYQGMFSGCTSLVTPPALPATSLTTSCYQSMFSGCTSLSSLSSFATVTRGATSALISMYEGCSLIKMSETQTGEYQNEFSFWAAVAQTITENMFLNTGGTFTGTPTRRTYYTANTIIS